MLEIATLPENDTILERLRASGEPATSEHRLGDWKLHAHRDAAREAADA